MSTTTTTTKPATTIPLLGITPARARAIAGFGRILPWKNYGAQVVKEHGVVLWECFDLMVCLFTRGDEEGCVVAIAHGDAFECAECARAVNRCDDHVREFGRLDMDTGEFLDYLAYGERFGTCDRIVDTLPRYSDHTETIATGASHGA